MEHYAVIMAGGGGTRLWPLSRRSRPKQALRLLGDRTLFQMAVDRLLPMLPADRILVVAVEDQAAALRVQCPQIPAENYLLEPCPRGTASVVGLAAVYLRWRSPDAIMAVLTADHYIIDVDRFRRALLGAFELAAEGEIVTLGIPPTHPATGFGYVETDAPRGEFAGLPAFRVRAFKEKPALPEAEAYVSDGRHLWNSGMFIWKAAVALEEIERWMPELHRTLQQIESSLGSSQERAVIEQLWPGLKSQTVDYGIMEKARRVSVIPVPDLGWFDLGGWNRLFELGEADESGNLVMAPQVRAVDTRGSLVFQDAETASPRLIAVLGVRDLVIVDTGDVLLVCPRDRAEEVRRLVEQLERDGEERYL
ncbi:MAG: sugar phosphate nucleotidyltransferase [Chloroflexota bacterium]